MSIIYLLAAASDTMDLPYFLLLSCCLPDLSLLIAIYTQVESSPTQTEISL